MKWGNFSCHILIAGKWSISSAMSKRRTEDRLQRQTKRQEEGGSACEGTWATAGLLGRICACLGLGLSSHFRKNITCRPMMRGSDKSMRPFGLDARNGPVVDDSFLENPCISDIGASMTPRSVDAIPRYVLETVQVYPLPRAYWIKSTFIARIVSFSMLLSKRRERCVVKFSVESMYFLALPALCKKSI